ncbi:MAG: ATP-binding protein [Bacteroidota bacterium]
MRKKIQRNLFFFLLFLWCCSHACGQSTLPYFTFNQPDTKEFLYLESATMILVDSTGSLSKDEVLLPENQHRFIPFDNWLLKLENRCPGWRNLDCPVYWIVTNFQNGLDYPKDFFYALGYLYSDAQRSWVQRESGDEEIYQAGFHVPLSQLQAEIQDASRIHNRLRAYFHFELEGQERVLVLSRLQHASSDWLHLSPRIGTNKSMSAEVKRYYPEQWRSIFIQGGLSIIILFYLFSFVLNRRLEFLYFIGYNLCMMITFLYLGDLHSFFFPEHPKVIFIIFNLAVALIPFTYAGFLYLFLNVPEHLPRLRRYFTLMMGLSLAVGAGIMVHTWLSNEWFKVLLFVDKFLIFSLFPLIVFIVEAIRNWREEFRYFLLASGFLLVGGLCYTILNAFGNSELGDVIIQFAVFGEMLAFAAGLGYKGRQRDYERARLESIDQVKTRLYTNITHEFRTPLTVILGMLDNIKGYENVRGIIRRNGLSLLRMVNQLLDLSKIDAGSTKLELVHGDVVAYLKYLTESFDSMAATKKIQIQFRAKPQDIKMAFDEVKLQHVIYNLLSNAINFTPAGGVIQVIVAAESLRGQPYLNFSVQDNGTGIAAEELPHIFDRYFQSDRKQDHKGQGTGIGLALTKELIGLMKGEITVDSKLGEGTIFKVKIPVQFNQSLQLSDAVADRMPEAILVPLPPIQEQFAESRAGEDLVRLLIIEDNTDVCLYIESLLSDHYTIQTANNGQLGIEKALETIPDIIISDVMMPEKDGFEVCQTLKSDVRTSHIPIILLTAKAEQSSKLSGLQYGADAYLLKPFDKAELLIRLQKLVEIRRVLHDKYRGNGALAAPENIEPSLEDTFLSSLRHATTLHMSKPEMTLALIARDMNMSSVQLYRKLKAIANITPSLFVRAVRLKRAAQLLQSTDLNVSEIAYEVGFNDPAYFSRAFKEEFGQSPSEFKSN